MKRLPTMLAMMSLVIFGSSCIPKKLGKSGAQSLDNLAAGKKVVDNICKGQAPYQDKWNGRINFGLDIKGSIDPIQQDKYIAKVKEYLTAVPVEMQKAFLNYGGEILLTGQAIAECNKQYKDPNSAHFVKEGQAQADSCFIYSNGIVGTPTEGLAVMVIQHQVNPVPKDASAEESAKIVAANEARLMHSGVRSFGMAFSQFFSKLNVIDPAKGAFPQVGNFKLGANDTFDMVILKENLANRFLVDVAVSKRFSLSDLEPLIGKGSAKIVSDFLLVDATSKILKSNDIGSLKPLDVANYLFEGETSISTDEKTVRMNRFKDFVMGEGLDSKFCSDASRKVIESDFVNSRDLLSQLSETIVSFANQISGGNDVRGNLVEDSAPSRKSFSFDQAEYAQGQQIGGLLSRLFGGVFAAGRQSGATPGGFPSTLSNNRPQFASSSCPNCATCMGNGCQGCGQSCSGSGCSQCSGGTCSGGSCGASCAGCAQSMSA